MLLLAALAVAAPDRAWIFVMDGHRASEGVDAGTENLEWLMGTMAPQGAIVYNLLNRDSTQTDGAHRGALSGHREPHPGLPWYDGRRLERALRPTASRRWASPGASISTAATSTATPSSWTRRGARSPAWRPRARR